VADLTLPDEIQALIESGEWARINGLVDRERVKQLFPEESDLHFYQPPLSTVVEEIGDGSAYWSMPETMLSQIDPHKILVLGDFGHGSDTTIALDYSRSASSPIVIRLLWAEHEPSRNNRWVEVSESFGEFCRSLGLLGPA